MTEESNRDSKDSTEDELERLKKLPEYKRFEKLLKQVISAPPMRKERLATIDESESDR